MSFKNSIYRKVGTASLIAALPLLSACSTQEVIRGYIQDEEMVAAIQPGVDNQDSVRDMLGSPSASSSFGDSTWYYISSRTTRFAFMNEKPVDQQILAINFDTSGNVDGLDRYTLADARDVNLRNDKTPTRGKKLGFFEQIFGNIGRFSGAPGGAGGPGG